MKPLFGWNHRWAMARGEESLRLELARRAAPQHMQSMMPAPPGPTGWREMAPPALIFAAIVALLIGIGARRR